MTNSAAGVARASVRETGRAAAFVLGPQVGQGMILRRPRAVRLAARADADARAAGVLAGLRGRYEGRPVALRVPGRTIVVVTDPDDAEHILANSPEPFNPATREKKAALAHFGPTAVLISDPAERPERRRFNEAALATGAPRHPCATEIATIAGAEVAALAGNAERCTLRWSDWERAWWRIARSVVLGRSAADDETVTDLLRALRRRANWAFLAPVRPRDRAEFQRRLLRYARDAEPGSVFGHAAAVGAPAAGPAGVAAQAPHWLFAFDAAGIATFRALALIAARPAVAEDVRKELPGHPPVAGEAVAELPFLRAVVEDSVRLYPTTLSILRETVRSVRWNDRRLGAGTLVVLPSSFLHRARPGGDALTPELWLDGKRPAGVVPFSAGPAVCAGRDLVLLTSSQVIGAVLREGDVGQVAGQPLAVDPLPPTLDHTALAVALRRFNGGPA